MTDDAELDAWIPGCTTPEQARQLARHRHQQMACSHRHLEVPRDGPVRCTDCGATGHVLTLKPPADPATCPHRWREIDPARGSTACVACGKIMSPLAPPETLS